MRGCLVPKILTQEQAQGVGRGQVGGAAGAGTRGDRNCSVGIPGASAVEGKG